MFHFNMVQLTALLKRQSEQNPSASYFNVDILKVLEEKWSFLSSGLLYIDRSCYSIK